MRQLPLYLRLQQLLDGELPEDQYREISDLKREFRELDDVDSQQHEASDEDLDLDEMERDLLEADGEDESDLSSLIERKTELEAQLFGDEDGGWGDDEEIEPLRELIDSLAETAGGRPWGIARPRLERLLRAVDHLDPTSPARQRKAPRKGRPGPGGRNIVATRRRALLKEFRAAWKEAKSYTPPPPAEPAQSAGAGDGAGEEKAASEVESE